MRFKSALPKIQKLAPNGAEPVDRRNSILVNRPRGCSSLRDVVLFQGVVSLISPMLSVGLALLIVLLSAPAMMGVEPDEEALRSAGFRKLQSRHLTLYTDIASDPEIDELPKVFDLAVPQWAQFFDTDPKRLATWHVVACLMKSSQRFSEYRLLPNDLPEFKYGIQRFDRLWLHEQPSAYYRRHLLLHEGTHAVMNRIFGRVGPVWYREGISELLGTHRYRNGELRLNVVPENRDQAEYWGRIKIVRDNVRKNGIRQIDQIVSTPTRAFVNSDAYGWSWALQHFLHGRQEYAGLRSSLLDEMHRSERGVTRRFLRGFQRNREKLDYDWNLFIQHLDYGYDPSKEVITFAASKRTLGKEAVKFVVHSDRGWQSTGVVIPENTIIEIAARGEYQLAKESISDTQGAGRRPQETVWISEPQGVTIEYYQGRPLGQLLAAVVPEHAPSRETVFEAQGIGRRARMPIEKGGQLFLRINERADRMNDNLGQITVGIRKVPKENDSTVAN